MNLVHFGQILNYGSAYGILTFIKELKRDYFSQLLILANERSWLRHSGEHLRELFDLGVKIRMIESTFFREPWNLDSIRLSLRTLRAKNPQLRHLTHGGFSALACTFEETPFLHMCHGFGMHRPSWIEEQDRRGISGARRVIAVSKDIRNQLINMGIAEQKIDVAYYPLRPQMKLAPKVGPIREIGMIGNLVPLKGQELGIDAFRALKGHSNLRLHIYGDGPLRESLEQKVKRDGLIGQVFFHGFRDMKAEYPKLDMILVPSLVEGLGMVNLEAFEHNLPVCAFASGGIPEIVKDKRSGFLAAPGNVAELSQCMSAVISEPDVARQMSLIGFQEAQEMFNPHRNCAIVRSGFEEMLGHHENIEISF